MIEFICRFGFSARLLEAAFTAFIFATCAIPAARRIALRLRMVSAPNPDSARKSGVPLLGGLPIIIAALAGAALFGTLPCWMLLGAGGLMLVGLLDDSITLRPSAKLILEAFMIAAMIPFFPPLGLTPWPAVDLALVSFFLLSTVNAYNLVDGLDGLAAGVGICSALGIAAIAVTNGESPLAIQSLAIAGALAGFLMFNRYPAAIFMGDCGALPLGFLLGVMALRASSPITQSLPVAYAIPLLIMLVPLLDTATVAMSRVSRAAPITRRGLDHSHHKLLALGFLEPTAVRICWTVAAVAAASAVFLDRIDGRLVLLILPSMVIVFAILALCVIDLKVEDSAATPVFRAVPGDSAHDSNRTNLWRGLAEILFDGVLIVAAYFDAFLLRLGPLIADDKIAALIANLPMVLVATYLAFLAAGLYRPPAPRLDLTRLASAAASAGITILLASYLAAMMVSGVVVLLFVGFLFIFLAAGQLAGKMLENNTRIVRTRESELARVRSVYLPSPLFSTSSSGEESAHDETEASKKVMAR